MSFNINGSNNIAFNGNKGITVLKEGTKVITKMGAGIVLNTDRPVLGAIQGLFIGDTAEIAGKGAYNILKSAIKSRNSDEYEIFLQKGMQSIGETSPSNLVWNLGNYVERGLKFISKKLEFNK